MMSLVRDWGYPSSVLTKEEIQRLMLARDMLLFLAKCGYADHKMVKFCFEESDLLNGVFNSFQFFRRSHEW